MIQMLEVGDFPVDLAGLAVLVVHDSTINMAGEEEEEEEEEGGGGSAAETHSKHSQSLWDDTLEAETPNMEVAYSRPKSAYTYSTCIFSCDDASTDAARLLILILLLLKERERSASSLHTELLPNTFFLAHTHLFALQMEVALTLLDLVVVEIKNHPGPNGTAAARLYKACTPRGHQSKICGETSFQTKAQNSFGSSSFTRQETTKARDSPQSMSRSPMN